MDLMLKLAITIAFGIVGARLARKLKLPDVTGYLVLGLMLGPSLFNLITVQEAGVINFVNELALACIAFAIGGEFLLPDLKRLGKGVFIITIGEVIGAVAVVFAVMYFIMGKSFVFSLLIASMSAATAPAATIMVIRQYRAYGPLTNTILPVAALDDALGIMVFGLALSIAKIQVGAESVGFLQMLAGPLIEILGALLLGLIAGLALTFISDRARDKEELISIVLCFVIGITGLANLVNVSSLLANMMLGAVVINRATKARRVFEAIRDFTPTINLLFFAFAGASLNLSVLASISGLGIVYVMARAGGKLLGATSGAFIAKSDQVIKRYLGFALLPQGGISIGLSMVISRELPQFSSEIVTVILFSVLVFEISGPILAKFAIQKAGEINGLDREFS